MCVRIAATSNRTLTDDLVFFQSFFDRSNDDARRWSVDTELDGVDLVLAVNATPRGRGSGLRTPLDGMTKCNCSRMMGAIVLNGLVNYNLSKGKGSVISGCGVKIESYELKLTILLT